MLSLYRQYALCIIGFKTLGVNAVFLRGCPCFYRLKADARRPLMLVHSSPGEAENAFEGGPHVLVPKRVDNRVHQRVALGQNQAILLIFKNLTLRTTEAVQQKNHQTWRPTDHKGPYRERVIKHVDMMTAVHCAALCLAQTTALCKATDL